MTQKPNQPVEQTVEQFRADAERGTNFIDEFDQLPRDEQIQVIRGLSAEKSNGAPGLQNVEIFADNNGWHVVQRNVHEGDPDGDGVVRSGETPRKQQRQEAPRDEAQDILDGLQLGDVRREAENARAAERAEYLAHPEKQAATIQDLSEQAMGEGPDAERAKLKLRQELDKLMKDPDTDFRNKVIAQMESDGARYKVWNGQPHVKVERDASGNPTTIEFTQYGDFSSTGKIDLTKSVEQQRIDAKAAYDKAFDDAVYGGGGKFDPKTQEAIARDQEQQNNGGREYPVRWWNVDKQ